MSRGRIALVAALVVVYAGCYSAIKLGLAYAPPLLFAGLRAGLGGVALLAVLSVTGRPLVPPRDLRAGVLGLALLGTLLGYGAMFLSPGRTGAGLSSVLGNTGPILLVVLGALFLAEPLTRRRVEGVALGALGVLLIAHPALTGPGLEGAGAVLVPLGAAAGSAGASVLLKRLRVGDRLLTVTAWQLVAGAVPLLLLSVLLEDVGSVRWSWAFLLLLGFLSLVGTGAALYAWYWLVQREEVGRLAVFLFGVPVAGLALAWAAFGETMGTMETIGVALTLAGILRVVVPQSRRAGSERVAVGGGEGSPMSRGAIPASSARSGQSGEG